MKKVFVMTTFIACFVLIQLLNSCRHELPVNHCETDPVILSLTHTDASPNQNNGAIKASATGGSGFQYSINGGTFQDSGSFTGLQPYVSYQVIVRNSWGCTDSSFTDINVFDPCSGVNVVVTASKTDAAPNQSNGSISASATGGNGFTFSINGGNFQNSGNFTNLAAGTYDLIAKNANGCTGTKQVVIGVNDPCAGVTVTVTTTQVNPTTGQSNGSIAATATGGTGFTYSLNNGSFQTSGTFSGLATGNYTITAKNANGCMGVTQVALGSNNPCTGVTITINTTQTNPVTGQSNGSITATASGSTGITYSLNNGIFQSTGVFSGLATGTYTITAKNTNGCLGTTQVTLTATSPCTNTSITISTGVATYTPCTSPNTGQITVSATGSTGFTYNLNGGTYQASNIFSTLAAGNYTVGVKDANGCTKTAAVSVGTTAMGPLFTNMRNLISTRCSGSGCHMNGTTTSGYNFDNDCSIVSKWNQINQSCVTYQLNKMPKSPQPLLTAAEKQVITNWINAGHRYTD